MRCKRWELFLRGRKAKSKYSSVDFHLWAVCGLEAPPDSVRTLKSLHGMEVVVLGYVSDSYGYLCFCGSGSTDCRAPKVANIVLYLYIKASMNYHSSKKQLVWIS